MTLHMALPDELDWHVSRTCDGGCCITVARVGEEVLIRNNRSPKGQVVRSTRPEWQAFVLGIKSGDFDDIV